MHQRRRSFREAQELVKLRFFGGMSLSEAVAFQRTSTSTADRYWANTRVYLYTELRDKAASEHLWQDIFPIDGVIPP
jgi:hypothetical protein